MKTQTEIFLVTNRTKQGCVMAQLLFCIVFSAMLYDAFKNCDGGIMIQFRKDGSVFSLCRLKSSTRVMLMLIREHLFPDDCALMAHTEEDLQCILNDFTRAAKCFGLTISIMKTEVMVQPRPGHMP